MQLSNEPAEELAKVLVDSGKGAFELCGFVSGGMFSGLLLIAQTHFCVRRLRSHGSCNQACTAGEYYHALNFLSVKAQPVRDSIITNPTNLSARTSSHASYLITATHLQHCRLLSTQLVALLTKIF